MNNKVVLKSVVPLGNWEGRFITDVTLTVKDFHNRDEATNQIGTQLNAANVAVEHIVKQHYNITLKELKEAFPEKFI